MIQRWTVVWIAWVFLGAGLYGAPEVVEADGPDATWVSKIVSIQGRVLAKRQGESDWQPVKLDDTFFAGDQIHVGANSRAGIVLSNDAMLRLDQNTTLEFTEIEQQKTFIIKLIEGAASFFSHRPRSLNILTPFVNGVVEGTEFYVQVDAGQARYRPVRGSHLGREPLRCASIGQW